MLCNNFIEEILDDKTYFLQVQKYLSCFWVINSDAQVPSSSGKMEAIKIKIQAVYFIILLCKEINVIQKNTQKKNNKFYWSKFAADL